MAPAQKLGSHKLPERASRRAPVAVDFAQRLPPELHDGMERRARQESPRCCAARPGWPHEHAAAALATGPGQLPGHG